MACSITRAVAIYDTRLLLFRALEFGIQIRLFNEMFCDAIQEQIAAMACSFAERCEDAVRLAGLRDASYAVIGIVNLGLAQAVGDNAFAAAAFLRREGAIWCFRNGWSRIEAAFALMQRAGARIKIGEDAWVSAEQPILAQATLAGLVAYQWGKPWRGPEVLAEYVDSWQAEAARAILQDYIIGRYAKAFFQQERRKEEQMLLRDQVYNTLFISIAVYRFPRPVITDVFGLLEVVGKRGAVARVFGWIKAWFLAGVPAEYHGVLLAELNTFGHSVLRPIAEAVQEHGYLTAYQCMQMYLNIEADTQQDVRLHAAIREGLQGFTRSEIPDLLAGNVPTFPCEDPAVRLAVLEVFVQGQRLAIEELAAVLAYIPSQEWQGKVSWGRMPWTVILPAWERVKDVNGSPTGGSLSLRDVAQDCLSAKAADRWWQAMPIAWAYEAMHTLTTAEQRMALLERLRISAQKVLRLLGPIVGYVAGADEGSVMASSAYRYLVLVLPEGWFPVWRRKCANTPGNAHLFLSLLVNRDHFPWENRSDAIAYLERAVRAIADTWKQKDDLAQAPAPFFAPHMEDAVRRLLTTEEFLALHARLA